MKKDYGEIFCTAVKELMTAELQTLQFDITKNCTVVNIDERHKGKYQVFDGSIKFDAYATESALYELNDQVLVNIPNGDYNLQKTIINRVVDSYSDTIGYKNPMDMMIKGTGNICFNLVQETGISANGKTSLIKILNLDRNDVYFGFTRIGLVADFKTLLKGQNIISGSYGLRALIYGNTNGQDQVLEYALSSSDMLGNPYEFVTYFKQQAVFDIPPHINSIYKIELYLYQDGNFKDGNGVEVEPIPGFNDIFINNVEMYLGYATDRAIAETLELAAPELTYNNPDVTKMIYLRWFHKLNENTLQPITIENWDRDNYEIRWYQYTPGTEQADEFGGPNWLWVNQTEPAVPQHREYPFIFTFKPNIQRQEERFKVVGIVKERPLQNNPNHIVEVNYTSNILTFDNDDDYTEGGTRYPEIVNNNLRLYFNDNSEGNYFLYDQNGLLINSAKVGQNFKRDITIRYGENELNQDSEIWTQLESITWEVPEEDTMIIQHEGDNPDTEKRTIFTYSIRDRWYRSENNNNTIRCTLKINGCDYVLTEQLRFGPKGSNGTYNTFILEPLGGQNALVIDDTEDSTWRIKALLVDTNGKEIYFSEAEAAAIEWTLINNDKNYVYSGSGDKEGNIITLHKQARMTSIPEDNYVILSAAYKYGDGPKLTTYLPIPMKSADCAGMVGPTEVIYNHQGTPTCGRERYVAIGNDGSEYIAWKCTQPYKSVDGKTYPDNPNPIALEPPKDGSADVDGVVLYPTSLYSRKIEEGLNGTPVLCTDPIQDKACVYCKDMWSQPILIMQSQYDFAMLNEWDGSLTIDEKNGTILATMIGAGRKNLDNTFSGVLMGDVSEGTGLSKTEQMTGVYGFDHGAMSFGLKEDGSAFFGASGKGRIEIDGNSSIIKSHGWTKDINGNWKAPTVETAGFNTGTVLDLDDAILLMQSGENTYLRFNDQKKEKLEVAANGVDIKLNNKGMEGLTPYIETSAQGIIAEVRRSANYYGSCDTESSFTRSVNGEEVVWGEIENNKTKIITLNLNVGNDMVDAQSDAKKDYGIPDIVVDDILKTGTTIAIAFTHGQLIKEVVTEVYKDPVPGTEQAVLESRSISREGHQFKLNIGGQVHNVYFDNKLTGQTNPFGWSTGAVIYFTFDKMADNKAGAWFVTDSGSHSKVTQTADFIRSEVANDVSKAATSITQTAESIRSEARRYAGYVGECKSASTSTIKWVKVNNLPDNEADFSITNLLQKGIGLAVTFSQADKINKDRVLKLRLSDADEPANIDTNGIAKTRDIPIVYSSDPEKNKFSWEAGNTVYFVYDDTGSGSWTVSDAGNYSRITQTAQAITSEVRRTATYNGTCSNDEAERKVNLTNTLKGFTETAANESGNISSEEIYQSGVTIAVTFDLAEETSTVKIVEQDGAEADDIEEDLYKYDITSYSTQGRSLELNITNFNKKHPIYINGEATGLNNPFGWSAGSVVYFTFDKDLDSDGAWKVSDSGSYSNITQTADQITSDVSTLDDKQKSRIIQTATNIRSEVADTAKGLATSISQTANAIISEARRRAAYYGISSTDSLAETKVISEIENKDWLYFDNGDTATPSRTTVDVNAEDLYQSGVTIGVKFTYAETPVEARFSDGSNADKTIYSTRGRALYLKILDKTFRIYVDGKPTAPPNENVMGQNNPFGWSAGDIIYFMFTKTSNNNQALAGYWSVTNAGAYSKITQTADSIKTEISDSASKSYVRQTASEIRSEVSESVEHHAVAGKFDKVNNSYYQLTVAFNEPYIDFSTLNKEFRFDIDFSKVTIPADLPIKTVNMVFEGEQSRLLPFSSDLKVENNETLSFAVRNSIVYLISLSRSTITQTKEAIIAEVINRDNAIYSNITQTADGIKSEVRKQVQNHIKVQAVRHLVDDPDSTWIIEVPAAEMSFEENFMFDLDFADLDKNEAEYEGKTIYLLYDTDGYGIMFHDPITLVKGEVLSYIVKKDENGNDWLYPLALPGSVIDQKIDSINAFVTKQGFKGTSDTDPGAGFGWNLTGDGFYMGTRSQPGPQKDGTVFYCDSTGLAIRGRLQADSLFVNENAMFGGIIKSGSAAPTASDSTTIYDLNAGAKSSNKIPTEAASVSSALPSDYWTNLPVLKAARDWDEDGNPIDWDYLLPYFYYRIYFQSAVTVDSDTTINIAGKDLPVYKMTGETKLSQTFKKGSTETFFLDYSKLVLTPELDSKGQTIYKCSVENPRVRYMPNDNGLIINLDKGILSLNKQLTINAPGEGTIRIGKPEGATTWKEISILPISLSSNDKSIGNLGNPAHRWDTVNVTTLNNFSSRDEKTNIESYNVDNAYNELREMPIYTFNYDTNSPITQNSPVIGTMIEYIPGEAMLNDGEYTKAYNLSSMVFWDIAATQALQKKLEEALDRIEELEYLVEELKNGVN